MYNAYDKRESNGASKNKHEKLGDGVGFIAGRKSKRGVNREGDNFALQSNESPMKAGGVAREKSFGRGANPELPWGACPVSSLEVLPRLHHRHRL